MKTDGTFFLRRRPCSVRLQSPIAGSVPGWLFFLGERHSQRGVQQLVAMWRGTEADSFIERNPGLKAGDCLALKLDRLHVMDGEICGFIERCEVAPDRWPTRDQRASDDISEPSQDQPAQPESA